LTEADSQPPDSSGNTVYDNNQSDSDFQTDSDTETDTDTDFNENDSSISDTDWYKQDIIIIRVNFPQQKVPMPIPIELCIFTSEENTMNPFLNMKDFEHRVCYQYPQFDQGQPFIANFPESASGGISGNFYIKAVLYVEDGGSSSTEIVSGVDFQGVSKFPVEVAPGSGLIQGGDIFLEPVHN
jgi:hypothetical protein